MVLMIEDQQRGGCLLVHRFSTHGKSVTSSSSSSTPLPNKEWSDELLVRYCRLVPWLPLLFAKLMMDSPDDDMSGPPL